MSAYISSAYNVLTEKLQPILTRPKVTIGFSQASPLVMVWVKLDKLRLGESDATQDSQLSRVKVLCWGSFGAKFKRVRQLRCRTQPRLCLVPVQIGKLPPLMPFYSITVPVVQLFPVKVWSRASFGAKFQRVRQLQCRAQPGQSPVPVRNCKLATLTPFYSITVPVAQFFERSLCLPWQPCLNRLRLT